MTKDESWVAEQVRLITLEDGSGPGYAATSGRSSSESSVGGEADAASRRTSDS